MWQEEKRRYLLPTVAMTKCHELEHLKQEKFIFSLFWRPELKMSADPYFQRLWGRIFSVSLVSEVTGISYKCIATISDSLITWHSPLRHLSPNAPFHIVVRAQPTPIAIHFNLAKCYL